MLCVERKICIFLEYKNPLNGRLCFHPPPLSYQNPSRIHHIEYGLEVQSLAAIETRLSGSPTTKCGPYYPCPSGAKIADAISTAAIK